MNKQTIRLKIMLLYSIILFCFCSCNTIAYYEENSKNKGIYSYSFELTNDGKEVEIEYLYQWGLPWHEFYMGLICEWGVRETAINYESITYDIYDLKGKFIEPYEEQIDIKRGSVSKYYKYSIFFPKKILAKIEIKYYYNDEYHEFKQDVLLKGKRNITWWSQAKHI